MTGYSILRQIQFLLEKMNLRQNSYRQVESVRWSKRVRARTPLMSLSLSLPLVSFPHLFLPLSSPRLFSSSLSSLFLLSLSLSLVSLPCLTLSLSLSLSSISLPYVSPIRETGERDEGKRQGEERQGKETKERDRGERYQKSPRPDSLAPPHTFNLSITILPANSFFLKETAFAAKSNTPSYTSLP